MKLSKITNNTKPMNTFFKGQAVEQIIPIKAQPSSTFVLKFLPADTFEKSQAPATAKTEKSIIPEGKTFKKPSLATKERPYCIFDDEKVNLFVSKKEEAIPELKEMLNNAKNEEEITEGLFIADKMIEAGTKGMDKLYYGTYSKFNENKSPNVQSFLSGVYRKILVPDAFGPLIKMLVTNIKEPQANAPFDPNEAIGGAILEHIKAPKINPL